MPVAVRLVRGSSPADHQEVVAYLSRVPSVGELVQWAGTTEPCRVVSVLHHALPPLPPFNACVASLEVQ